MQNIMSFSYEIAPNGKQPALRFGFIIPKDSILDNISYYAIKSPTLILHIGSDGGVPPAVLGDPDGGGVSPNGYVSYSFVLTPITGAPAGSQIAFTAITNIGLIGTNKLDIYFESPDGTNIPSSAAGNLTLQLRS